MACNFNPNFPFLLEHNSSYCEKNVQATGKKIFSSKGEKITATAISATNEKINLFVVTFMKTTKVNQLYLFPSQPLIGSQSCMISDCVSERIQDITILEQHLYALTPKGVYKYMINVANTLSLTFVTHYPYIDAQGFCVANRDLFGFINKLPDEANATFLQLNTNNATSYRLPPPALVITTPVGLTFVQGNFWLTATSTSLNATTSDKTSIYQINPQGELLSTIHLKGYYEAPSLISPSQFLLWGQKGCTFVEVKPKTTTSGIKLHDCISACAFDSSFVLLTKKHLVVASKYDPNDQRTVSVSKQLSEILSTTSQVRLFPISNDTIYGTTNKMVFALTLDTKKKG